MSVPVFINGGGGTAKAKGDKLADELHSAFDAAGLAIDLNILDGADLPAAIAKQADAPLVVVGGGDGTLAAAAQVLVDHGGDHGADSEGATLGILPLGTLNHLAKELGIPADLPAAAKLIAKRPTRRIDVARVNGRVFVNNASVGMYPLMVREREAQQDRGLPKWLATLPAAREALRRLPHHRLHLHMPDRRHDVVTPLLFVGNNRYALEAGKVGQRAALDDGVLSVFAVASHRRMALLGFALRALVGRADLRHDFAAIGEAARFMVDDASSDLDVALDGEVETLEMPLHFEVLPEALAVVAPLEQDGRLA